MSVYNVYLPRCVFYHIFWFGDLVLVIGSVGPWNLNTIAFHLINHRMRYAELHVTN